jgi:hypothetical protein
LRVGENPSSRSFLEYVDAFFAQYALNGRSITPVGLADRGDSITALIPADHVGDLLGGEFARRAPLIRHIVKLKL